MQRQPLKADLLTMKRLLLLFFICYAMAAHASSYNYLVFTNTAGTTTAFSVNNLTLTVNGTELQITNANETVQITLTALKSMQFSTDGTTALENVLNADAPVQVFSISGSSIGTYTSLLNAAQNLNAGTYVITNGSASQTIIVK